MHQGEQLDNIEAKTDSINEDMKTSQRHLNSIKSVFGGIKNWWSGEKKKEVKEPTVTKSHERESRLKDSIDAQRQNEPQHPALRLRSEDVSGFYEDDTGYSRSGHQQQREVSSGMAAYDQKFNQNLGKQIRVRVLWCMCNGFRTYRKQTLFCFLIVSVRKC